MEDNKPETLVTSIRIPKTVHEELSKLAKAGHRSINQQIVLTIETGLEALRREQSQSSGLRNAGRSSRLS